MHTLFLVSSTILCCLFLLRVVVVTVGPIWILIWKWGIQCGLAVEQIYRDTVVAGPGLNWMICHAQDITKTTNPTLELNG